MTQIPRRTPLDKFDELVNAKLRVYFTKQMHMVWHDFQFNDFAPCFVGDFVNNRFQPLGNIAIKNLPAILRTENNNIVQNML